MKLDPKGLPDWRATANGDGSFSITLPDGFIVFAAMPEQLARMVAAAPRMLRFMASFRMGNPVRIDADRALAAAGIELDRGDGR